MRHRLQMGPREAALVPCTMAPGALGYTEGGIWPREAAAMVIPLSLPVG